MNSVMNFGIGMLYEWFSTVSKLIGGNLARVLKERKFLSQLSSGDTGKKKFQDIE